MEKKIDIVNKYQHEILNIKNKLNQLDKGRVYEISDIKQDGYLSTNVDQLREMISDLIYKIEYGEEPATERIRRAIDKIDFR